jgi:hypothetical protein
VVVYDLADPSAPALLRLVDTLEEPLSIAAAGRTLYVGVQLSDGLQVFDAISCYEVADLNLDGVVDAADLAALIGAWGASIDSPADFDGDGAVGASDLAVLIASWGS